jgi:tetratricopeptide (TPR) repeat protein
MESEIFLREAISQGETNIYYFFSLVLSNLDKELEAEEFLHKAYLENDVSAVFKLGVRSSDEANLDLALKYFSEGMNLGDRNSAVELIKILKRQGRKSVEISIYKQALLDKNKRALSALEFLTLGRHSERIQALIAEFERP